MKKIIFLLAVCLFFIVQINAQKIPVNDFKIKASLSVMNVLMFDLEIKMDYIRFKTDDSKNRIFYLKKINSKLDSLNYSLENHIKILGDSIYRFNKNNRTPIIFTKEKGEYFKVLALRLQASVKKALEKNKGLTDDDIKIIAINYDVYDRYFKENYNP